MDEESLYRISVGCLPASVRKEISTLLDSEDPLHGTQDYRHLGEKLLNMTPLEMRAMRANHNHTSITNVVLVEAERRNVTIGQLYDTLKDMGVGCYKLIDEFKNDIVRNFRRRCYQYEGHRSPRENLETCHSGCFSSYCHNCYSSNQNPMANSFPYIPASNVPVAVDSTEETLRKTINEDESENNSPVAQSDDGETEVSASPPSMPTGEPCTICDQHCHLCQQFCSTCSAQMRREFTPTAASPGTGSCPFEDIPQHCSPDQLQSVRNRHTEPSPLIVYLQVKIPYVRNATSYPLSSQEIENPLKKYVFITYGDREYDTKIEHLIEELIKQLEDNQINVIVYMSSRIYGSGVLSESVEHKDRQSHVEALESFFNKASCVIVGITPGYISYTSAHQNEAEASLHQQDTCSIYMKMYNEFHRNNSLNKRLFPVKLVSKRIRTDDSHIPSWMQSTTRYIFKKKMSAKNLIEHLKCQMQK